MESTKGLIIKSIGGLYSVKSPLGVIECKARGIFRKQGISPLVGDTVKISVNVNAENTIDDIIDRKNSLVRPPLANLDQLFIVASLVDPNINTTVIDRLIGIAELKNIEPIIVLTKIDLSQDAEYYKNIYEKAGFKVILCDNNTGRGSDEVRELIKGKISAFTGNTGVGKSSLLNSIDSSLEISTGETSKKLGRGKHTTRHCELYKINGGYVADTPGFSYIDLERYKKIMKDDLPFCFREFEPFLEKCRFQTNCSHINDKGCAVVDAVNKGLISKERHQSYIDLYNEVKDIKEWQLK